MVELSSDDESWGIEKEEEEREEHAVKNDEEERDEPAEETRKPVRTKAEKNHMKKRSLNKKKESSSLKSQPT